jgi:hypothetical protein
MFLTTLMTDDRLVADLDYSDAPCPDRDDICSITVTPAEMVALMEEDIEKEEPLPPFPKFEEATVRSILRNAHSNGYFKNWETTTYGSLLQTAKSDKVVATMVEQGPVRGQFVSS